MTIARRTFLLGAPALLAGCNTTGSGGSFPSLFDPTYASTYGELRDGGVVIPALDLSAIDSRFLRRQVAFTGRYAPGTVVVDPYERYAYFVMGGGRAMRYGVGVGRTEAFNFRGEANIARKAVWPSWTPTANMIRREPQRYGPWAGGMPGGLDNPLGARALYLYRGGQDTYYRLHGTNEPYSIGTMVSSGCVRFLNHDIIDLYERVPVGARAVVLSGRGAFTS